MATNFTHQIESKDSIPADAEALDETSDIVDWKNNPENPFNWTRKKKWALTLTACFAVLLLCLNSTSPTIAANEIDKRFNIDETSFPYSYWLVSSWSLSFAIVSLVVMPMMEEVGVRYGYLVSAIQTSAVDNPADAYEVAYTGFAVFVLPQAFAQNFATLIVARLFSGGCAGILTIVLGSIIGDVFEGERERTIPMNIFIFCYMNGLALGPVEAGAVLKYLDWRWILYIQAIIYFAVAPIFMIIIKETRHSVILRRIAKSKGIHTPADHAAADWKSWATWQAAIIRPVQMLLTEPAVFFPTMWSAFSLGTIFLFTQSIGQVYSQLYGWSESSQGLVLSAIAVGQVLGCLVQLFQDDLYFKSAKRNTECPGTPIPEARLYLTIPGTIIVAFGFFIYAWTSYSSMPWIAPTIGLGCVGFGSYTIVLAVAYWLTDAYPKYGASSFAAGVLGENAVASFLPFSTRQMYTTLGLQWASSLLGFVALVMTVIPIVFLIYGRTIRERSRFIASAGY